MNANRLRGSTPAKPPAEYDPRLPAEVQSLRPRMRQVATIVYFRGGATVREVQADLGGDYNKGGLRTMLARLEKKGIVRSRWGMRGSKVILYVPAILTDYVRDLAVQRLVEDHFEGSVDEALRQVMQLISRKSAARDGGSNDSDG